MTIVPMTKTHNPKAARAKGCLMPKAKRVNDVAAPARIGLVKFTLRFFAEARRHAMTPLVMKVPKIERQKAMRTRTMFQTFNIPFFSWIITEWMKADMASHGMRLAFSTGSQAQ